MAPVLALTTPPTHAAGRGTLVDPLTASARLTAGAARVEIVVPEGTPLAGYGALARRAVPDVLGARAHAFWFRSHRGTETPVFARALVLVRGGARVVWLTADLIAIDGRLADEVARRLEAVWKAPLTTVLSASHTHSGPGAFTDSEVLGVVAMDRPDPSVREAVVNALVGAAERAERGRVPAALGVRTVPGPDVTRGRLAAPVDRDLVAVKVAAADGRLLAIVWNFAIHATMLGPRNLALSGDVTGAASRTVEDAVGVPALYVNGAVGDVSPRGHGAPAMHEVASRLARAVQEATVDLAVGEPRSLDVQGGRVGLGPPALALRNCIGTWVPATLTIPARAVFPTEATVTAIAIGDLAVVAIPGELQSALGRRIKDEARARWRHVIVAGLTNDYLGYFVGSREFQHPGYVSCASLYGAAGGERLVEGVLDLLRGLGAGQR